MKKILSILLAVAVLFSFAACSDSTGYTFYGKKVASVTLADAPDYLVGETVNPADVSLRVVFNDGTEATVSGQDVGMKTSDGSFEIKAATGLTFNFNYGVDDENTVQAHSVVIKPVKEKGLEIDPTNAVKEIALGTSNPDTKGIVYTVLYDGGEKEVSETLARSLFSGLSYSVSQYGTDGKKVAVGSKVEITATATDSSKIKMTSEWVVEVIDDPDAVVGYRVEQKPLSATNEVFFYAAGDATIAIGNIPLVVTEVLADGTDGEELTDGAGTAQATGTYKVTYDLYADTYQLKAGDENKSYSGKVTVGGKDYEFTNLRFEFTPDYPSEIKVTRPTDSFEDTDTIDIYDFGFKPTKWQSQHTYADGSEPSFAASEEIQITSGAYVKAGTQDKDENPNYEVGIKYVGEGAGSVTFTDAIKTGSANSANRTAIALATIANKGN